VIGAKIRVFQQYPPIAVIAPAARGKVMFAARVYLAICGGTIVVCLATSSVLPAMFVALPRIYGGSFSQLFNLTQHAGMNEDVYDHRLNTRTVIMNPVVRFLCANMTYHI
jgi:fatty acid desaturase